jgi:acyl dehydratase
MQIHTSGRTITEADVVNFAGVSGDFDPIHMDEESSSQRLYGRRIAHGLLVLSIASGLLMQTGILDGTVGLFREINQWKFIKPVFLGDTIRVRIDVLTTKAAPALGGGLVKVALFIHNQEEKIVMKGNWTIFVLSRPNERQID